MSKPTYSLRGHYAGFVSRTVAFLIDRGIILAIVAIFIAVGGYLFQLVGLNLDTCVPAFTFAGVICGSVKIFFALFALLFAPIYTVTFWSLTGQTPGKYFMGLRIYRMDGKPLTLSRSIRRYIGYLLSFLAFGLGFFWITIDDQRQGFHDIFAKTCVVYSWDAYQNQRLINRLSLKINKSQFLKNPDAFYSRGMTEKDADEFTSSEAAAPKDQLTADSSTQTGTDAGSETKANHTKA